jgi:hypothetical protein
MKSNKYNLDKSIPGPGAYSISTPKSMAYSIGIKCKTSEAMAISTKNKLPGPGAYSELFSPSSPSRASVLSTMR